MTSSTSLKERVAALKSQKAARPFEDTTQLKGNKKLFFLTGIIQKFARAKTPRELANLATKEICLHLRADQVFLLLRDPQEDLHIWSQFDQLGITDQHTVSQSICEKVMAGEAVLIPEALSHPYFQTKESVLALNLRSVMACPISSDHAGAPIGVLYVCSYTSGELFNLEDVEMLKAIAIGVGVNLDRTRLLAEKDRLLKEQKAMAASRGRMVEVANHELGTPVHRIWTGVAVCQQQFKQIKLQVENGQLPDVKDMAELETMLEEANCGFAALKSGFLEPFRKFRDLDIMISRLSPAVLSAEALEMMLTKWQRLAANHRLKVFNQLPVGLRCDPTLFDIAMTHLIDNAVKYSPPGSPINVTADLIEDALVIAVKDEGIGIPEEDLPNICDCLIRGRNVVNIATFLPGMGLGLDVVRRIVEAHGGDLTIKSILGRGTQVAVSLPVFIESV